MTPVPKRSVRAWLLPCFLALGLPLSVPASTYAGDEFVRAAKALSAHDFDNTLPDQSTEAWLQAHLPTGYQAVWGEEVTDCGEGGGAPIQGRDMPLCAEVKLERGAEMAGYLALMVGTHKRGLSRQHTGVYFGYLEHAGTKYEFRRLSDVLKVR